jgi:hypothetical protein
MIYRFDPNATYIAVETVLVGPSSATKTVFALDTGATQTGVDSKLLKMLGFDLSKPLNSWSVATPAGVRILKEFRLQALSALGIDFVPFDVIAADFSGSSFEGVLGLDFCRGRELKIDFRAGTIELN